MPNTAKRFAPQCPRTTTLSDNPDMIRVRALDQSRVGFAAEDHRFESIDRRDRIPTENPADGTHESDKAFNSIRQTAKLITAEYFDFKKPWRLKNDQIISRAVNH